jgi:Fur family peroxide stress response transcriptional regulator
MNFSRRKTKQRDMVFAAVHRLEHPTAQEVYTYIKKTSGARVEDRISLGTIYRNLQVLEEEGRIISVPAEQPAMHYDARLDAHYHFLCRNCGRVLDVPVDYNSNFDLEVEKQSGCRIESHGILFKGMCGDCLLEEASAMSIPG